ncbi:cellulose-binding domain-containing protein [Tieghemostelium lacteum]|uniref:Cellulose-binding domain-containing protein n=1 Tax=Tieghemostelium lacteum TaxID=361077 RepID=A0A152A0T3_TIELA|nr:cellulose-binding domain-containing protein [Tieghemostelium lacteum]|eukprot:KYQ99813.1 cellulose-binding domain-containing protein [Tieghemostelium lacteum]
MKSFFILAALLLTTALASASYNYPCGPNNCQFGEICHTIDQTCRCIPHYSCHDITLTVKKIGQWTTNGCTYTQYDVIVNNNLNRNVKQLFIGTDSTLTLRDNSSIWNVERSGDNLTLPHYQDINANASYTFGFIIIGTHQPNLYIKAVVY